MFKTQARLAYTVPVVICKRASHNIRDTTYATSLESAITDRP